MHCKACGNVLERAYYLPYCTGCIPADPGDPAVPGIHRIERRYAVFKVVAPLLGLGAYALVYAEGIKEPFLLGAIVVGWAQTSALAAGVIDQLRGRRRL